MGLRGWLGRIAGITLIIVILMVTPFAFWMFNLYRVALNPQTYKTALRNYDFYSGLLPAFVDIAASDDNLDANTREAAQSLLKNVSAREWQAIADKLLPPQWLQGQIDGNIDRFFSWLNVKSDNPNIFVDLRELKNRLSSDNVRDAAQIIVRSLPKCTAQEEEKLKSASAATDPKFPLCAPSTTDLQKVSTDAITATFKTLGKQLPEAWRLTDEFIHSPSGDSSRALDANSLVAFRASVTLSNRAILQLFLLPIALFAIVIITTIRSSKQFFRWLGWGLILSGLITLLPMPFTSGPAAMSLQFGEGMRDAGSGSIIGSLMGGMVFSILASMNLAMLMQVAVIIVIGFACVFISVLLPAPLPDVTLKDVQREQEAMQAMQSSWMQQAQQAQQALGNAPIGFVPAPSFPFHQTAPTASYPPGTPPSAFPPAPTPPTTPPPQTGSLSQVQTLPPGTLTPPPGPAQPPTEGDPNQPKQ